MRSDPVECSPGYVFFPLAVSLVVLLFESIDHGGSVSHCNFDNMVLVEGEKT